jgi:hypothetical protein
LFSRFYRYAFLHSFTTRTVSHSLTPYSFIYLLTHSLTSLPHSLTHPPHSLTPPPPPTLSNVLTPTLPTHSLTHMPKKQKQRDAFEQYFAHYCASEEVSGACERGVLSTDPLFTRKTLQRQVTHSLTHSLMLSLTTTLTLTYYYTYTHSLMLSLTTALTLTHLLLHSLTHSLTHSSLIIFTC